MNPIPYFCSNTRKRLNSEYKRVAREIRAERQKKRDDENKRMLANAARVASEIKDISV